MKDLVDMTRLSSKGQVVIPGEIREELSLAPGTKFLIYASGDTLILKRVGPPSREEIDKLLKTTHAQAKKAGLKKKDLIEAIQETRKGKKKT